MPGVEFDQFKVRQTAPRGGFPNYYQREYRPDIINFPTGELLVRCEMLDNIETIEVTVHNVTMDGLFVLAQIVDIARTKNPRVTAKAIIPFFPNARQDRRSLQDESFSLKVYTKFLNSLGLDQVTVLDPHSDVVAACVNNCKTIPQHEIFRPFLEGGLGDDVVFVAPDAGAYKKTSKAAEILGAEVVTASKRRNPEDGVLEISCDRDLSHENVVIIDDICDGGGTFIGLMKAIKESSRKPPKSATLIVTHGIFSKGLDELKKHFELIVYSNGVGFDLTQVGDPTVIRCPYFTTEIKNDRPQPFAAH